MDKKIPIATGDCATCPFKKGMANKAKGKKIGYPPGGKCTRPGGFCEKKESSSQAPETLPPDPLKPGNEAFLSQIYPNPDRP